MSVSRFKLVRQMNNFNLTLDKRVEVFSLKENYPFVCGSITLYITIRELTDNKPRKSQGDFLYSNLWPIASEISFLVNCFQGYICIISEIQQIL
jgi:hypothetical protein